MHDDPRGSERINRRSLLGALGTGALAGAVPGVTTGARGDGDRSMLLLGTHADPVTPAAIRDELADLFGSGEASRDGSADGVVFPIPDYGDDESVVAYLAHVDEHGRPTHYVGAAPQPGASRGGPELRDGRSRVDVDDATEMVAQRHARAKTTKRRLETGEETFSTTASSDFTPDREWNHVGGGTVENGECPDGTYQFKTWLWRDSDTESYAMGTRGSIYPGDNECDAWSSGSCGELYYKHKWDETSMDTNDGHTLQDHEPSGGHTGQLTGVSLSVSYTGAGVGFSYSQPGVSRNDNSSSDRAEWHFQWNDDESSSAVFRLASIADYRDDDAPYLGSKILETYAQMRWSYFTYNAWDDHSETWTFYPY